MTVVPIQAPPLLLPYVVDWDVFTAVDIQCSEVTIMHSTRWRQAAAAALGMFLLILDSHTALQGASDGIMLCIRTVIPSLFPFLFLSSLLTDALSGSKIPLLTPICRLLKVPIGSEGILVAGFLGGYPVGAQAIQQAYKRKQLSSDQARRMLAFCNNAGPAFLFGMAASLFPYPWMPWTLWGIHVLSAILVAIVIPREPAGDLDPMVIKPSGAATILYRSCIIQSKICGWIILFRILITVLFRWIGWCLPAIMQIILSGVLELSNGCYSLLSVDNIGLRFLLCSGFLGFGGFCVMLQTYSAAEGVDTSLYLPGKLLHTALSILMASAVQYLLPMNERCRIPYFTIFFPIFIAGLLFFAALMRNKCGNPETVVV